MNPQKNTRAKWLLPVGIGCVLIFCLCGATVGGYFLIQRQGINLPFITAPTEENRLPTKEPIGVGAPTSQGSDNTAPTDSPLPTAAPTEEPFDPGLPLTGSQYLDQTSMFDDFSSDALMWPVYDDGSVILQYEQEAYSFQIKELDFYDWAYIPVEFSPTYIKFDAWELPGEQNGTFGVFCQMQDPENYYYVEFDLETNEYVIGQYLQDQFVALTEPDSNGQYWITSSALRNSPEQVNTIEVSCTLDSFTLTINGNFEQSVQISQPFATPGEMAFFLYTFPFAGSEGYKIFFDNVSVHQ